jgi:hypothetical protein
MQQVHRNLRAAVAFWALCLMLYAAETVSGYQPLAGLVFLLSLPALVGWLAWINRPLLGASSSPVLAFLAYAATVLTSAVLIVAIGLLAAPRMAELLRVGGD